MIDLNNLSDDFKRENADLLDSLHVKKESNRQRGYANMKQGEEAEDRVKRELEEHGFLMVEKIETGYKVVYENGKVTGAWPNRKVTGDYTAIVPDGSGRFVICEVKSKPEKLIFSALQEQQVKALNQAHELGAISLLAWHNTKTDTLYIMRWPVFGKFKRNKPPCFFGSGMSIKPFIAEQNLFSMNQEIKNGI